MPRISEICFAFSVCRAVVSEVNLSIRSADPKKKVQAGSFRVDSKGNQQTVDVSGFLKEFDKSQRVQKT